MATGFCSWLQTVCGVMPNSTEKLGQPFHKIGNLPRLDHAPALEFVDTIQAHENQEHGSTVIDDADDHLDLAPHSPELFGSCKVRVTFVEVL